jgi:hypothetical protein
MSLPSLDGRFLLNPLTQACMKISVENGLEKHKTLKSPLTLQLNF